MRIKEGKKVASARPQHVDLTQLYFKFKESHRNVFMHQIDETVFIYRTLGRDEYRKIQNNEELDDMDKEEIICGACVLYPEDFNYEECSAGLPTELCEIILKASLLDSKESQESALEYYRLEMHDFQNQITCLINEAFPQLDIEEIEQWDMEQTMRYLSRAEWKLHNLRGLEFREPEGVDTFYEEPQYNNAPRTEEVGVPEEEPQKQSIRGGKKENIDRAKLQELQQKFPEIPWHQDTVLAEGEKGLEVKVDTTSGPLRTDL